MTCLFLFLFLLSLIFVKSDVFMQIEEGKKLEEIEFRFKQVKENRIEPIVLIPGLGGSSLNAKLEHADEEKWWCFKNSNWYRIWLNVLDLVPHLSLECLMHNMKTVFDPVTKRISNIKGVKIKERNFGATEPVEYLTPIVKKTAQVLKPTVDYFVKAGYKRGKSIRGAPYDFRLSPQELEKRGWFNQLKELVEETYRINNNTKVHLLGHSLGGPIGSLFLGKFCDHSWKEKYVSSYFAVAPSFDGSIEALGALKSGTYSDMPFEISKLIKTFGGLIWMFPRKIEEDKIIVYSQHKNYTNIEMQELLHDMGYGDETFALFEHLGDPEYDPTKFAPKVKLHCVYGIGRKTAKALLFDDDIKKRSSYKIAEYEDGDCTVPEYSSHFCQGFDQEEEILVHNFKGEAFKDTDYHRYIVGDQKVLDSIFQSIYGEEE